MQTLATLIVDGVLERFPELRVGVIACGRRARPSPSSALFSSDYPHTEGGRNPVKRFDESLAGCTPEACDGFWWRNFEDLMGAGLPEPLRVRAG